MVERTVRATTSADAKMELAKPAHVSNAIRQVLYFYLFRFLTVARWPLDITLCCTLQILSVCLSAPFIATTP